MGSHQGVAVVKRVFHTLMTTQMDTAYHRILVVELKHSGDEISDTKRVRSVELSSERRSVLDVFVGYDGDQEGSCLVELVVVLAIVGILLSIAIIVFPGAVREAEEAVCITHRRHLDRATHLNPQTMPEKALRDYLGLNEEYACPASGIYLYTAGGVACSIHDDIECHVVCAHSRRLLEEDYHSYIGSVPNHHPIATWSEYILRYDGAVCPNHGEISYSSGRVICSLHHGGHDDDDEDDGSVPFL